MAQGDRTAPLSDAATARSLVLLRHGRTAYNRAGRIQGQVDAELDEAGHEQAAAAAVALAALAPSVLWSSDLARTRATAAYVAKETGLDPTYDARLREYALGEREGLSHEEYAAAQPEEFARFRLGDLDAVRGGERSADVAARMLAAITDLLSLTPPGGVAVAVSHGAAIRVAVTALQGWPAGAERGLHGLDNCGWVEMDEGRVDPDGPARLRLRAYNRVAPELRPAP